MTIIMTDGQHTSAIGLICASSAVAEPVLAKVRSDWRLFATPCSRRWTTAADSE